MRKLVFLFVVSIFVGLLWTSSYASNWILIGKDFREYIDLESINKTKEGTVRVWYKADNKIYFKQEYLEFNCKKEKMFRVLSGESVTYITLERKDEKQLEWDYIRPDTVLEAIEKHVCKL